MEVISASTTAAKLIGEDNQADHNEHGARCVKAAYAKECYYVVLATILICHRHTLLDLVAHATLFQKLYNHIALILRHDFP